MRRPPNLLPCARRRRSALAAVLLAGACVPATAQVVTSVSFDASASALTAPERAAVASHLQEAVRRWAAVLAIGGPRSIELRVALADIPTADGASATTCPVGRVGARDTYEQGVACELRSGTDPNGGEPDALIRFGLAYLRGELWFDPQPAVRGAPVPSDRTDAMSVALHEIGHAIAYSGWSDLVSGESPATYWSTFDRWTVPGSPSVFAGARATAAWHGAPDLTTGNNKHWGNASGLALPAARFAVPAPVVWRDGVPLPQATPSPPSIDAPPATAAATAASLTDELMNGVVFYRGRRYDISPLDLAVLGDAGLAVDRIHADGFER